MSVIIAIYIRLSSEDKDIGERIESNSISNQRDMIYDYIANNLDISNNEIVEYIDDGFSGTNTNRTAFKQLLDDARNNNINCIIVKDLSRLSRNYVEAGNFLEQVFPFLGIRFISINDSYDSENFKGITGGFEVAFKNLIYDLYSKDLSRKVKAGNEIKLKNGEYVGAFAPFGYKKSKNIKNKLEISVKEAEIVKLIFDLRYYNKKSLSDIARELNLRKIKTPSEFFKERLDTKKFRNFSDKLMWTYGMISRILKEEVYTGTLVGKRRVIIKIGTNKSRKGKESEKIRVENTHEAIISKEIFETINLKFTSKKNRKVSEKILRPLRSKVRCGYCRRIMSRSYTKETYYKCYYAKEDFNLKHLTEKFYESNIEIIVLDAIKDQIVLLNNTVLKAKKHNVRVKENHEKELSKLKIQVKKIKNENLIMYEKFKNGKISKEIFIIKKSEKIKIIKELEDKIDSIKIQSKILVENSKKNSKILGINSKMVSELTYELVSIFIDKIYVYSNENIEIVWNFKDVYND